MLTIVFMSYYYYGVRAVLTAGLSCLVSVFSDYIACAARRIKFDWQDVSPVMSGLLLALLMPATVPYTVMAFSAAFMSLICKNAFGGNKNPIFCPVCVSYIFTTFCFPSYVRRFPTPEPFGKLPLTNIVTEGLGHSYTYALDRGTASTFSLLDIVWGKLAGPMGTAAVLIILICGIALYFFGDIPSAVFFSGFGANVLINVMLPVGESGWYAVLNSLVAGSFLFVLVFMACDLRYVPKKIPAQVLYGVAFALGSYFIRKYTNIENGAIFTLPILCALKDELDRLSDALERLLIFLWKHIRRFSALLGRKSFAALKKLWEFLSKQFDKFTTFIAKRLHEAESRRSERIDAARGGPDKPEDTENNADPAIKVSGIVVVNDEPEGGDDTDNTESVESAESADNNNQENPESAESSESADVKEESDG